MIKIDNPRDFALNPESPTSGEFHVEDGATSGHIIGRGMYLFQNNDANFHRLDTAGVHGNEIEGQLALNETISDVIAGRVALTRGKWLAIFGNIEAMSQNERWAKRGYNLNRLFALGPNSRKGEGTYEKSRALQLMNGIDRFHPTEHNDWHGTIKPATIGPFAIVPHLTDQTRDKLIASFPHIYGINHILASPTGTTLTTFSGWTSQEFGSQSATVELGQLHSPEAKTMIPKAVAGIHSRLLDKETPTEAHPELVRWEIVRELIKATDAFDFTQEWKNFQELGKGTIIATDGDTEWEAEDGEHIVFPFTKALNGERCGSLIKRS